MNAKAKSAAQPKRKIRTQAAGVLLNKFVLIIAAALLLLAAWAGQTVIVVLLGLGLAAAGLARLWSYYSLKGTHCERQLTECRAFPDGTLELKLRVVNRKILPLPWFQVSDEIPAGFIGDQAVEPGSRPGYELISRSGMLPWYSASSWKYHLVCKKRGYYALGPLSVTSGDIFGFYPATFTEPQTDHIIVYPRIFSVTGLPIPSLFPIGEARSEKRIFEDPSRMIGIRRYSPGDSLRRIHWKASARQQQLQVKVFEPTTSPRVAVFLAIDSFQVDGVWNYEAEELGISTAASLTSYLVDMKCQAGLWCNSKLADSGEPARILLRSGVDQLVQVLEALAKVVSIPSGPFLDFFHAERKELPSGTTLVFIFQKLPENLREVLIDLQENGYKVLVFQTGNVEEETLPPGITWYQVLPPGKIVEVNPGELY